MTNESFQNTSSRIFLQFDSTRWDMQLFVYTNIVFWSSKSELDSIVLIYRSEIREKYSSVI